jgi:hypothetical protein
VNYLAHYNVYKNNVKTVFLFFSITVLGDLCPFQDMSPFYHWTGMYFQSHVLWGYLPRVSLKTTVSFETSLQLRIAVELD